MPIMVWKYIYQNDVTIYKLQWTIIFMIFQTFLFFDGIILSNARLEIIHVCFIVLTTVKSLRTNTPVLLYIYIFSFFGGAGGKRWRGTRQNSNFYVTITAIFFNLEHFPVQNKPSTCYGYKQRQAPRRGRQT